MWMASLNTVNSQNGCLGYAHFTDEDIEGQRGDVTRSRRQVPVFRAQCLLVSHLQSGWKNGIGFTGMLLERG